MYVRHFDRRGFRPGFDFDIRCNFMRDREGAPFHSINHHFSSFLSFSREGFCTPTLALIHNCYSRNCSCPPTSWAILTIFYISWSKYQSNLYLCISIHFSIWSNSKLDLVNHQSYFSNLCSGTIKSRYVRKDKWFFDLCFNNSNFMVLMCFGDFSEVLISDMCSMVRSAVYP